MLFFSGVIDLPLPIFVASLVSFPGYRVHGTHRSRAGLFLRGATKTTIPELVSPPLFLAWPYCSRYPKKARRVVILLRSTFG